MKPQQSISRRSSLHVAWPSKTRPPRLANTLIEWARPRDLSAPARFAMTLTHEELGSMAGITRETTSRLLARFEREALIHRRGAFLEIPRPDRLAALTE